MESTQNIGNKRLISQLKGLESGNNAEILKAIYSLRDNGTAESIPFLVKILVTNPDEDIKNEIAHLLFDLKNIKALPALILAIHNPENKEYQALLVSACWESGLDCSPFLKEFVYLAISSDYLVAIECLTVIENMTGPFHAEELEELIVLCRSAADEDDAKFLLLNSLWEVLVDFRR